MLDPASPTIPATLRFDGGGGSTSTRVQLCQLTYHVLSIPEVVEFVLDNGARERFTRSGSNWVGDSGIRGMVASRAPGPIVLPDRRVGRRGGK